MANLGSNDTAVEGLDFSLPAGAQLDEESGDLVIRDSGGNVVFRRDEAAGEWVTDSLNLDQADIDELGQIQFNSASDLSDSRSTGTTYQNTEDYTIVVSVAGDSDGSSSAVNHGIALRIGKTSSLTATEEFARHTEDDLTNRRIDTVFGFVPPGYYYEVNTVGRSIDSLFYWVERGMRP